MKIKFKQKRNLGALIVACIADWILMTLLLIWFWFDMHLILKLIIFSDIFYSLVILSGTIITRIQDKQINEEFRKLCEKNERL